MPASRASTPSSSPTSADSSTRWRSATRYRLDVITRRAAKLQAVDAQLTEVERSLDRARPACAPYAPPAAAGHAALTGASADRDRAPQRRPQPWSRRHASAGSHASRLPLLLQPGRARRRLLRRLRRPLGSVPPSRGSPGHEAARRLIRGPIRPDRWTALRFASLRWAALPVIDRRWTVPLAAIALALRDLRRRCDRPRARASAARPQHRRRGGRRRQSTVASTDTAGGGNHGGGHSTNRQRRRATRRRQPRRPTTARSVSRRRRADARRPRPRRPRPPRRRPRSHDDHHNRRQTPTRRYDAVDRQRQGLRSSTSTSFAGSYTVAARRRHADSVHASEPAQPRGRGRGRGPRARQRHLGRERRPRVAPSGAAACDLAGTVTFSDPRIGAYTVSATGSSILVRVKPGVRMPEVGDQVAVDRPHRRQARPDRAGRRRARRLRQAAEACRSRRSSPSQQVDARGHRPPRRRAISRASSQGVCRKAGSLILSADDLRESGRDVAIAVPTICGSATIDIGQVLKIRADIGSGGNLTAKKIAADDDRSAADDAAPSSPTTVFTRCDFHRRTRNLARSSRASPGAGRSRGIVESSPPSLGCPRSRHASSTRTCTSRSLVPRGVQGLSATAAIDKRCYRFEAPRARHPEATP